jgi:hypothetical protein
MTSVRMLTGSDISMRKAFRHLALAVIFLLVIPVESFALTLEPFDEGSLAVIKKRYEGQAFVLVFWSIHCEFCAQEMSYWRVLKRKHPGVPVIMVSMDPPSKQTEVERFIERHNPGKGEFWMFAADRQQAIRRAVDGKWHDKMGRIYLYDVGHRRSYSSGAMNRSKVNDWMSVQTCSVR